MSASFDHLALVLLPWEDYLRYGVGYAGLSVAELGDLTHYELDRIVAGAAMRLGHQRPS